jgi:Ca2+/Na+ antiporter
MINFFPSYDMSFKEKIITLGYLIIFISVIASLLFRKISFFLFGIIIMLLLYYVYLYNQQSKIKIKEELNTQNRDIINNKFCVKPNKNNPFMNPNIINDNNNNLKACFIDDRKIKRQINTFFKDPVYKDVNDIYDTNYSQRQFYTMPSTTIPNDQEALGKWLYDRKKTCKENNGEQCYNNIM